MTRLKLKLLWFDFVARCRAAYAAFRGHTNLVVIYDVRQPDGSDSEEYYGFFASGDEALLLFNDAFGNNNQVHSAYLCLVVEPIKGPLD